MTHLIAKANQQKNGLVFASDYSRGLFLSWLKKYGAVEIQPVVKESKNSRGYLEGAVVPAYCQWQYGIDARARGKGEQRRFLFKRDFNYEVVKNRDGEPVRTPVSSLGLAVTLSDTYTRWADQNGAPIPNSELYKLWRDKWSMDFRFPTFFEFLEFLGLECDAMPSDQTLSKLNEAIHDEFVEGNKSQPKDLDPDKVGAGVF